MSVTVTRDDSKRIIAAIEAMAKKRVLIGIPGDGSPRKDSKIGNAALGYIHENGSAARNIPARPFLIPGVRSVGDQAADVLKNAAKKAVTGESTIDKGLHAAGMIAQNAVKMRIRNQEGFAPLANSTLRARKRKGKEGTKALIRTGQLINSIKYVIKGV